MTDQEIEKLREKLGRDYSVKRLNGAITVELVDIWKGVEFAECVDDCLGYDHGKIYHIKGFSKSHGNNYVDTTFDEEGDATNGINIDNAKPSTESAYVEQLKAKAKELYGEIKDGDRFDRSEMGLEIPQAIDCMSSIERGWYYSNAHDQLYFGDLRLYNKGKWAKKVTDPIRVEFKSTSGGPSDKEYVAWFRFQLSEDLDFHEAGDHLAKCLEDYLNKIP